MLKAIHKETGKLVSAVRLNNDLFWMEKERDEWIAPKPEIGYWKELIEQGINEIKVAFVKRHIREMNNERFFVQAHFRINTPGAVENPLNESDEHKLAKEGIYDEILNDSLIVDGKNISTLGEIIDLDIEHRLSKNKFSKIADVCLTFKEQHPLYGKGIIFEIQFSYQKIDLIQERTYDRILEGYSVCWLFNNAFNFKNELIDKNVIIVPFLKALEDFHKTENELFLNKINGYSNLMEIKFGEINNKLEFYKQRLSQFDEDLNRKSNQQVEYIDNKTNEVKELFINGLGIFKNDINILSEKAKISIINTKENSLKEITNDKSLLDYIKDNLDWEKMKSQVKENLLNDLKEPIIKGVAKIAEEISQEKIKSIDINKLENEFLNQLKSEILPQIRQQLKLLDGFVAFKCPLCSRIVRIETMKFIEERFVCGECYGKRKTETEKAYYKREVLNDKNKNN